MERRRSHRKDKIKATNETSGKSIHQIQHYARTDETKKKKKKLAHPHPTSQGGVTVESGRKLTPNPRDAPRQDRRYRKRSL